MLVALLINMCVSADFSGRRRDVLLWCIVCLCRSKRDINQRDGFRFGVYLKLRIFCFCVYLFFKSKRGRLCFSGKLNYLVASECVGDLYIENCIALESKDIWL